MVTAFLAQLISCAITNHPLGCGCWRRHQRWHCEQFNVNLVPGYPGAKQK